MEWKAGLQKLFGKKNNFLILIIIIIGIVLLVFPFGKKETKTDPDSAGASAAVQKTSEKELEERLEAFLKKVSGAGDVSVMIVYSTGGEKTLAYDINEETREQTDGQDGKDTQEKKQTQAVLEGDTPVIVKETFPEIQGVIVAAEGAGDAKLKLEIMEAVKTVLGIDSYKVKVLKKG